MRLNAPCAFQYFGGEAAKQRIFLVGQKFKKERKILRDKERVWGRNKRGRETQRERERERERQKGTERD